MPQGRDTDDGLVAELPIRRGAVIGAVAYVVGYLLTYVLIVVDGGVDPDRLGTFVGVRFGSDHQVVGWVFYGAHLVETELGPSGGQGTLSGNPIASAPTQVPSIVYYAVPIAILVVAGLLLVDSLGADDPDLGTAAAAGATVVAGYFPLAVVGVVVFTGSVASTDVEVVYGPVATTGVSVAGVAYPVVLGAVGGVIGADS